MSFLASQCYKFASKGPRPPLRVQGPEPPHSCNTSGGSIPEIASKTRRKNASLAIACSGCSGTEKQICVACRARKARPASMYMYKDALPPLDPHSTHSRSLTALLSPPSSRRCQGPRLEIDGLQLSSCVDYSIAPGSQCGCENETTSYGSLLTPSSQCEDLVTALELYRSHLFTVLVTSRVREIQTNDSDAGDACDAGTVTSATGSSTGSETRGNSNRYSCGSLQFDQLRQLWEPHHVLPLMSVRHLHSTARNFAEGDEKKAVVTMRQRLSRVPGAVKRAPAAIWREIVHLYHGFRLLAIDIKIASKLMRQILNGGTLSRREKNQLVRTVADAFRLVPFLVFIIVPFMEFLLPVALKLFPNMLPSTFETEDKKREKNIKKLKAKVEIAKFLQATLKGSLEGDEGEDSADQGQQVEDFMTFLKDAQTSGKPVRNEDILKYSALFENEITLDNLERPQLIALCQLLELQPIGTNNFLRFQIRMQLRSLKADDRLIRKEGVPALAVWELQAANRARGMRSLGLTENQLQNQLKQWLELHLDHKIPATLLLLSRIIYIGEGKTAEAQLAGTMTKLSELSSPLTQTIVKKEKTVEVKPLAQPPPLPAQPEVIQEVIAGAAPPLPATTIVTPAVDSAATATPLTEPTDALGKIMLLKLEEEKIKAEKEELKKKEELEKLKDAAPEEKTEADTADKAPTLETGTAAADKAPEINLEVVPEKRKSRVVELNEQLAMIKTLAEQLKVEDKSAKGKVRLDRRVKRMIASMDKIIARMQKDRKKHAEMLKEKVEEIETPAFKELDLEQQQQLQDAMAAEKQRVLTLDELVEAVAKIQKVNDKDRIAKIVELLDEDRDGAINQEDVLRVLELIGRENIKLSDSSMGEILTMVHREALLEEVERAEAQLESAAKVASDIQFGLDKQTLDEGVSESTTKIELTKDDANKTGNRNNSNENRNSSSEDLEEELEKKQQRNA